jgi:hypothetical protein
MSKYFLHLQIVGIQSVPGFFATVTWNMLKNRAISKSNNEIRESSPSPLMMQRRKVMSVLWRREIIFNHFYANLFAYLANAWKSMKFPVQIYAKELQSG